MEDPERQRLTKQHNALKRWVAERERQVESSSQANPALLVRLLEAKHRLNSAELALKVLEARRARDLAEQLEAEVRNALMAAAGGVR